MPQAVQLFQVVLTEVARELDFPDGFDLLRNGSALLEVGGCEVLNSLDCLVYVIISLDWQVDVVQGIVRALIRLRLLIVSKTSLFVPAPHCGSLPKRKSTFGVELVGLLRLHSGMVVLQEGEPAGVVLHLVQNLLVPLSLVLLLASHVYSPEHQLRQFLPRRRTYEVVVLEHDTLLDELACALQSPIFFAIPELNLLLRK